MSHVPLVLDREYPPPGEAADIERMVGLIRALHHPQADGRVLRAQHAKDTGCVRARLVVEPGLPEGLRRGIFREGAAYDAIVRFSNASEFAEGDGKGTPRGMAIKVGPVEGERAVPGDGGDSQDFLLVDSPSFIFRAVKDYTALFALRRRLGNDLLALLGYILTLHLKQAGRLLGARRNRLDASLVRDYWSMSPFRFGARAVKFKATPSPGNAVPPPPAHPKGAADFLFAALADRLKTTGASFDFAVQFQADPDRMPIEDASVTWDEAASPFVKVATLEIPAQDLAGSAEARDFRASCERLGFNPWHALADHRPLGGLNRLRRPAYEASVRRRLGSG